MALGIHAIRSPRPRQGVRLAGARPHGQSARQEIQPPDLEVHARDLHHEREVASAENGADPIFEVRILGKGRPNSSRDHDEIYDAPD
jgi:hypothetical protein